MAAGTALAAFTYLRQPIQLNQVPAKPVQLTNVSHSVSLSSPGNVTSQANPGISFQQFRQQLLQAIKRRDAQFVRALVTPQTQWSYGGSLSLKTYAIDNPKAAFWQHLEKAVQAGCAITSPAKTVQPAPNVWTCPDTTRAQQSIRPDRPVYGETSVAILAEGVNIRSGAGTQYPVIQVASHEYLPIAGGYLPKDYANLHSWTPVTLSNGKRGFVQNRFAFHSPTDFRVGFNSIQGQWRLHHFLPGEGN